MTTAHTPPTPATHRTPPRAAPVLPAAYDDTVWLGYEAALPWIRISPPLARPTVSAR
jgi:hypothetical protein